MVSRTVVDRERFLGACHSATPTRRIETCQDQVGLGKYEEAPPYRSTDNHAARAGSMQCVLGDLGPHYRGGKNQDPNTGMFSAESLLRTTAACRPRSRTPPILPPSKRGRRSISRTHLTAQNICRTPDVRCLLIPSPPTERPFHGSFSIETAWVSRSSPLSSPSSECIGRGLALFKPRTRRRQYGNSPDKESGWGYEKGRRGRGRARCFRNL